MGIELCSFRAKNFKPFEDTGWIDIKPITLFFGHNSSGKSALLSILPMLQQTMQDPDTSSPFIFASDIGVDLGSYEEVSNRHIISIDKPVWFCFDFCFREQKTQNEILNFYNQKIIQSFKKLGFPLSDFQIEIAAAYNKKRRQIAIINFSLKNQGEYIRISKKSTAANISWKFESSLKIPSTTTKVNWHHFLPSRIPIVFSEYINDENFEYYKAFSEMFINIDRYFSAFLQHLIHIGPLRDVPKRAYRMTGQSPKDVGEKGENWLNIFLRSSIDEDIAQKVNFWLKKLGYSLKIDWGKQGYVHPILIDNNGLGLSLKDVGFGISQILPVLIQGFTCKPGTILLLEQPEIHLHPKAQAELGDIIIAIASRGVKLLIETHSEHLLLRLQRRIAENSIDQKNGFDKESFMTYFLQTNDEGGTVFPVHFDYKGEFISPPQGLLSFFSDDYFETIKWSESLAKLSKYNEPGN